jgi:isopentenyl-diphosphate delta-isomerase
MEDKMGLDPAKGDALVLVDGLDRIVGETTKERAHREGLLHRAFSIVLTRENADGEVEICLAQRALSKYHSPGLWANSCCSHPRAGDELEDACFRRLGEELGCSVKYLTEIGSFVYRAEFSDGLVEYEYDHVFVGEIEGVPQPDPNEVEQVRWVSADGVARELVDCPEHFCVWAFTVLSLALAFIEHA